MHAVPVAVPSAPHSPASGVGQAPGGSAANAYALAVLCWLLSAGVYIAAKSVAPEMPPWALCFFLLPGCGSRPLHW